MKQGIFTTFLLFFLAVGNFVSHAATSSTWVVNPDKMTSFDVNKQQWLAEALAKSRVKIIYDKTIKAPDSDSVPVHPQSLTLLVKGKYVSVYLITPSLEALHVGLVVNNMLTLKGEALQEFNHYLRNVAQTFQDLGYGDYLAFCDLGKKYRLTSGGGMKGNCWEMIPLGKGYVENKDGNYTLAPKIWRNNYMLFSNTPEFKQHNSYAVLQFVKLLKAHIGHMVPHAPTFCKATLPWKIHIADLEMAKQRAADRVLVTLQKRGAVQVLESEDATDLTSSTISNEGFKCDRVQELAKCDFCKPDILKKQRMVHGKMASVFYNRNAYSKNAHFMIIPNDHKESFQCLGENQFKETLEWAQKMSYVIGDTKNIVWFCQNGPRAGQTMPHTHIHILRRPDPLYFSMLVFDELKSNKLTPYGEKEFESSRIWIHERLKTLGLEKTGS